MLPSQGQPHLDFVVPPQGCMDWCHLDRLGPRADDDQDPMAVALLVDRVGAHTDARIDVIIDKGPV